MEAGARLVPCQLARFLTCTVLSRVHTLLLQTEAKVGQAAAQRGEAEPQNVWRGVAQRHAFSLSLMYAQSSAREADAAGGDSEKAQEARDKEREVMANVWKGLADKQLVRSEVAIAAARALLPPESSGVDKIACFCSACGESGAPVARRWCLQGTPVPTVDGGWLGGCNPEWEVQLELLRSEGKASPLGRPASLEELCAECCVCVYGYRWHEFMNIVRPGTHVDEDDGMQVDEEEEPVAPAYQPHFPLDASAECAPWDPPPEPAAGVALQQLPPDELAEGFAPDPSPRPLFITVPCEAAYENDGSARDESPTASFGAAASPAKADVGSASTQNAELHPSASFGAAVATSDILDPFRLKVSNFPKANTYKTEQADEKDLLALFKPYNFTSINDVYIPKDRTHGYLRSFGFVRFGDAAEAAAAQKLLNNALGGMTVIFADARPKRPQDFADFQPGNGFAAARTGPQHAGNAFPRSYSPSRGSREPAGGLPMGPCTELYVSQIDFSVTVDVFRALARQFGFVIRVTLPLRGSTEIPLGYGFVSYKSPADAAVACEALDGFMFAGRRLAVKLQSHPRTGALAGAAETRGQPRLLPPPHPRSRTRSPSPGRGPRPILRSRSPPRTWGNGGIWRRGRSQSPPPSRSPPRDR
ncbi:hypothetical protein T492DRAFT_73905 [Pavlovales sp. CCMP2436]|nr:hypothetical protein T492DRAFT_73905 [Pavlovales sp. CCMP2436]